MSIKIIPFYAGLLGLFYLYLTVRVIKARNKFRVALGDGGHKALERGVAAHANFAEYVPFTLLLLAFLEVNLLPAILLHALGILFVVGRVSHALGVAKEPETFTGRKIGMVLTMLVLFLSAAFAVYTSAIWLLLG